MLNLQAPAPGAFCWLDLAASDADSARAFYARAFGWTFQDREAAGGLFTVASSAQGEMGSLYQLRQTHLSQGVPSHWTPYVRVEDADATCRRLPRLGGQVIVQPFEIPGTARIALVQDSVGAVLGLWQAHAKQGHG